MTPGLHLKNLHITLGPKTVARVTAHIAPGQVLTVMGPSGSGKSTLLSAITGTLDPADHLTQTIDRASEREAAFPTRERLHHQAGLEPPEIDHVLGIDRSHGRER